MAGQSFDRGIGTQSRTLLAYRIEPGDRRFQALVGVDERAGPLGSVVFRVLVDGTERYQSAPLTDRDAPKAGPRLTVEKYCSVYHCIRPDLPITNRVEIVED